MEDQREQKLDNIFDRIQETRGRRDASARNSAEELLAGDVNAAIRYAERSHQFQHDLDELMAEMSEMYPRP